MDRLNQRGSPPGMEVMNFVPIKHLVQIHKRIVCLFAGAKVGKKEAERNPAPSSFYNLLTQMRHHHCC